MLGHVGSVDRRAVPVNGERLAICTNPNISGVCEIRGLYLHAVVARREARRAAKITRVPEQNG
jgi:hypothetical protein